MAYNAPVECSAVIQRVVGLSSGTVDVPHLGNRTQNGQTGYDKNSASAVMNPMSTMDAVLLLNMIPQDCKDGTATGLTPAMAQAVLRLANNAATAAPLGCAAMIPGGVAELEPVTFFITPGGNLIQGKLAGNKFFTFLFNNMDAGLRVKWFDLTGHGQYEWIDAWENAGRNWVRNQPMTMGLRGTNLNEVTFSNLENLMMCSSSLADHIPCGHATPRKQVTDTTCTLFGN